MYGLLTTLVTRRGWIVVLGWVALATALVLFAPDWKAVSRDDDVRFFPAGYPTVRGQDLLERGFPNDVTSSSFVVVAERRPGLMTVDDLTYLDHLSEALNALRQSEPELGIKAITDRRTPIIGPRLIGELPAGGGQAALVSLALKSTHLSKQSRLTVDRLHKFLEEHPQPPEGLTLATTGSAAVGHDQNTAANRSLSAIEWSTVGLVLTILLVVYRSPLLALTPLLTIALSVFIALKAIPTLSLIPNVRFQVIDITKVFVPVILFGAGTDYCLFLIARYREELARGRRRTEALIVAIEQVGGALVASAGTVIIGLGMLYFSSFAKIQYTGPAIALSLAISLLAALTLAPVVLYWLRGAVFWPFRPPHHESGHDPEAEGLEAAPAVGLWTAIADRIVHRPGLILGVSLVALLPLAVVGARTRANYSQTADLGPNEPSIVGTRIVQRYFAAGELSPSTILIHHPNVDFRSEEGTRLIAALTAELATVPNVAEVRAVSRPLGKPLPRMTPSVAPPGETFLQRMNRLRLDAQRTAGTAALRAGADPRYVGTVPRDAGDRNHITRIEVVFRTDPFSPESMATLRRVLEVAEAATLPGGTLAGADAMGLGGSTAMVNDLADVTTQDERRMYVLVTLGVYAILVLLLRRPGVCLYLIATVVLGYLASLGLTELTFKWLHQGPEPWLGLDWKVGFFLFVILVAVGEDYNIFLMARVIEEERLHGPIEGTRLAVAHTGGIISSCGLIMAGTFLSMLTGTLASLQQLGFALGMGVMLDTFIVRPILVPAYVVLWHRWRPAARIESPVAGHMGPSLNGSAAEAAPSVEPSTSAT